MVASGSKMDGARTQSTNYTAEKSKDILVNAC